MSILESKKTRKLGLAIEALENRNLLTVLLLHTVDSSGIDAVFRPVIEAAHRLNHTSAVEVVREATLAVRGSVLSKPVVSKIEAGSIRPVLQGSRRPDEPLSPGKHSAL